MKKFVFLAPILLSACDNSYTLTQAEQQTAQLGAMQYATADNAKFVSCSGLDSNSDNYVTCSISEGGAVK
jgi:hypothetical protein